jgi:AI-2 transport protein TqsA
MSTETAPPSNWLINLAAFIVVIAGMRAAETLLVPFLLAIFISIVSAPVIFYLRRLRIPLSVAMLIVISGVILFLLAMAALIGTSLDSFSRSLPGYQEQLRETITALASWMTARGIEIHSERILSYFDPGAAMNLVAGLLSGLGGVLRNIFLILLTVIFILLEGSGFPDKLRAAFGPNTSFSHFNKFRITVNRYLAIKTVISLATGVTVAAWLILLGVNNPLLWGLLAFLLNYIPTIGSIIAAVPPVLLALIQLGPGTAGLVAAGYLVVNIVTGNVIEPRFMGRSLGLSTLVVFVSLVFWGWVLGPVGMILSVPLTMTIKIALDSNKETRWIAIFLGPDVFPHVSLDEEPAAPADIPRPSGPPGGSPGGGTGTS